MNSHNLEVAAFTDRLTAALKGAGVKPSATVLAHEFNLRYWGRSITVHTARSWLKGISIPTQDKLRVLSDWLGVAPDELRFGQGSVHSVRDVEVSYQSDVVLTMQDRQMLNNYLALPVEERKTARDVIAALAKAAANRALVQGAPLQTKPSSLG